MKNTSLINEPLRLLGEEDFGASGHSGAAMEPADVELLDAYSRAVIHVVDSVGPAVVNIRVSQNMNGANTPLTPALSLEGERVTVIIRTEAEVRAIIRVEEIMASVRAW